MAYRTFAAIDVGSTDVTMKIYEVTAKKGVPPAGLCQQYYGAGLRYL